MSRVNKALDKISRREKNIVEISVKVKFGAKYVLLRFLIQKNYFKNYFFKPYCKLTFLVNKK